MDLLGDDFEPTHKIKRGEFEVLCEKHDNEFYTAIDLAAARVEIPTPSFVLYDGIVYSHNVAWVDARVISLN